MIDFANLSPTDAAALRSALNDFDDDAEAAAKQPTPPHPAMVAMASRYCANPHHVAGQITTAIKNWKR